MVRLETLHLQIWRANSEFKYDGIEQSMGGGCYLEYFIKTYKAFCNDNHIGRNKTKRIQCFEVQTACVEGY